MKDKVIRIRVDEKFIEEIEYLRNINNFQTTSETIRAIVSKEYKKETMK